MTSLLNAGPQSKADLTLTAAGTGNEPGAVYSMVKLDPQLAIPRAGITTHSLSVCLFFAVCLDIQSQGWISCWVSACCS